MSKGDYTVGYGKPPKHSQFVKGESGNKGRRKKRLETHAEIIARHRDEMVDVGGVRMSKFELAIASTYSRVIKSGKPGELKSILELMDKYGAIPKADEALQARIDSDLVMEKISMYVERQLEIDPRQREIIQDLDREESRMVLKCPNCSRTLRDQWHTPERKALAKDCLTTHLQSAAEELKKRVA